MVLDANDADVTLLLWTLHKTSVGARWGANTVPIYEAFSTIDPYKRTCMFI